MRPAVRRRTIATLTFAWLVATVGVAHAAFEFGDSGWEGCSELLALARERFGRDRVLLTGTLDWSTLRPEDGVLLVHPTTTLDPDEAASFMRAGGRLAVVDDHGTGDRLLRHFKVTRRNLPGEPAQYLRGNPAFALAVPAADSGSAGVHPTAMNVSAVVLNHATGLDHPDLTPVLEVRGRARDASAAPDAVAVAVAGQVDKGRLFAVSDPSAFINSMLRYPGNRTFAQGMLRYLAEGSTSGSRPGRLVVLANSVDETGSFGGATPARKAIDRRLRALRNAVDELRTRGFPGWLHLALAAGCAAAVIAWAGRALLRLPASRLPRFARPVPQAAQGGPAGRLAVLTSPSSPPELAMLELRAALVEGLDDALGRAGRGTLDESLEALRRRVAIEPDLEARVKRVARWMADAEATVVGGGRSRLTPARVLEASPVVQEVLRLARESGAGPLKT